MKNTTTMFTATKLALCAIVLTIGSAGYAGEKDTLDATDVAFVKREAAAGKAEVTIAELAVSKANRTDVKAFAETLVTDHTAVNSQLAELAAKKGVEVSAVISPAHAAVYQKLEKFSGAEFDKEFLAIITSDHKKCITSFEEAAIDAKDDDVKSWAGKTLPALKSHLAKAEELSAKGLSAR